MKIRKLLQGWMVVALLLTGTAVLHAQNYSAFVEGGLSTAYAKRYYTVFGGNYSSTYKSGNSFTVGGEIPVRKNLSAEASYSMSRNNLAITNVFNSTTPNDQVGYGIRNQRVSLDALAHPPKSIKGVRPYLVVGVEYDRFEPTSAGLATAKSTGFNGVPGTVLQPDDKFGWNFGGGLEISLTHLLAFRIDARDHRVRLPTYGLPSSVSSGPGSYYPVGGHMNNIVYSAGFVVHFGL